MIKRLIYKELKNWATEAGRKPLLLRGARQVGKTYIINEFGKKEFENYIIINFERNPEYKEIFSSFDPKEIIERISIFTGQEVIIGKTLLFLDEIQEHAKAITALRYFYEEMPDLHVIGAGSLLEFALRQEDFKMPVGRIQYLYMYPLNFNEFLEAIGEQHLNKYLSKTENLLNISNSIHEKALNLVRKYFIIGGMPEVVKEYISTGDIIKCQKVQSSIISTYKDDFGKYAKASKFLYLQKIFQSASQLIGQKFVYAKVDDSIKSRELKDALQLLELAGILIRVKNSNGDGLPLEAHAKENYFKAIFLDIGLVHRLSGVSGEIISQKDLNSIFRGAIAEQFVGQELLSNQSPYTKANLYYWARDARGSNAEIDYLIEHKGSIIPIEVKSGHINKMKSLWMFIEKYKSEKAIRVSQSTYTVDKEVISVPFYALDTFMSQL